MMSLNPLFTVAADFQTLAPVDATGQKASYNSEKRLLGIVNATRCLNFFELMKLVSPHGTVRIKEEHNNMYVRFANANEFMEAIRDLDGHVIGGSNLRCRILKPSNIDEQDDDFVPDEAFLHTKIPPHPAQNELVPIYNLVTVEDDCNEMVVFNLLDKLIHKPPLTPETFTKFSRNVYLIKVKPYQGHMLRGTCSDYSGSGIIKTEPYQEYNGSKGKIYNSFLSRLSKSDILNQYPPNVIDAHIISEYEPSARGYIPTPLIILKFSNPIAPDVINVKPYTQTPRTCARCLKYGHSTMRCTVATPICRNCGEAEHDLGGTKCPNEPTCVLCKSDHRTFSNVCVEHKRQKLVPETAYNQRTSFRNAATIVRADVGTVSYTTVVKAPTTFHITSLTSPPRTTVRSPTEQRQAAALLSDQLNDSQPQREVPYLPPTRETPPARTNTEESSRIKRQGSGGESSPE